MIMISNFELDNNNTLLLSSSLVTQLKAKHGPYLAGLIEGDGSINVPGSLRNDKGILNFASIEIVFDIKDMVLAENLQSLIGGYITKRKKETSCRLIIKKADSLYRLILLINGCFRTPKIEALHRLIIWYNDKHATKIPLLGIDLSPLGSNSWLAGILDADCSFYFN